MVVMVQKNLHIHPAEGAVGAEMEVPAVMVAMAGQEEQEVQYGCGQCPSQIREMSPLAVAQEQEEEGLEQEAHVATEAFKELVVQALMGRTG